MRKCTNKCCNVAAVNQLTTLPLRSGVNNDHQREDDDSNSETVFIASLNSARLTNSDVDSRLAQNYDSDLKYFRRCKEFDYPN